MRCGQIIEFTCIDRYQSVRLIASADEQSVANSIHIPIEMDSNYTQWTGAFEFYFNWRRNCFPIVVGGGGLLILPIWFGVL